LEDWGADPVRHRFVGRSILCVLSPDELAAMRACNVIEDGKTCVVPAFHAVISRITHRGNSIQPLLLQQHYHYLLIPGDAEHSI
jgi:hypothetical protein